jgi:hypothetical protein
MTTIDLKTIIEALRISAARRIDLSDDRGASALLRPRLELAVLEGYDEELSGLDGQRALEWLVRRMARIEASVSVLEAALARAGGPANTAAPLAPLAGGEIEDMFAPRSVSVDLDENVVQSGFYHHETLPAGDVFRWLGPDPVASVYLPRIDGPVRVVIRAMKAFDGVPLDETRVSIDGGEWASVSAEREGGVLNLTATPERGAATATTRVDIDCIRTISPHDSGVSDTRRLGIAIYGVDLVRVEKGEE